MRHTCKGPKSGIELGAWHAHPKSHVALFGCAPSEGLNKKRYQVCGTPMPIPQIKGPSIQTLSKQPENVALPSHNGTCLKGTLTFYV